MPQIRNKEIQMSYEVVGRMLETCLDADLPLLIEGGHGIGKSEIVACAAKRRAIGFLSLDLSAAEPVDLLGLPSAGKAGTTYLPPACLPRGGSGILFYDELNRALRQVRAALLSMITCRSIPLSGYTLPPGWRIVAACNPAGGEYHTDELDPALASRFVRTKLEPDVRSWADWAQSNDVHPEVIAFVRGIGKFTNDANPRAWVMLSRWLKSNSGWREDPETLTACAEGLVGRTQGRAFIGCVMSSLRPLSLEAVLSGESAYRSQVSDWTRAKRVDLFRATADVIREGMQHIDIVSRITGDKPANLVATDLVKFGKMCPSDIGIIVFEAADRYRAAATTQRANR